MRPKNLIYWLLFAILIIKIPFLFKDFFPWWDAGIYVGMGKAIWSFGAQGLWEPIRPLLWPAILGMIWKMGFPVIFFGRVLELAFSLGIAYLSYRIAARTWNRTAGLYAAAIISFSTIIFSMSFRLYAGIPAAFFTLLAFYLFTEGRMFLGGVSLGAAVMTKFTTGIFLLCFIPLFWKRLKQVPIAGLGMLVPILPYLIFNQFLYHDLFFPLKQANHIISQVLTCNELMVKPWYSYLGWIMKSSILFIAIVPAGISLFKKPSMRVISLFLSVLIPLFYLFQLSCRIERYLIIILPFAAILAGYGLSTFRWRWLPVAAGMILVVQAAWIILPQDWNQENEISIASYKAMVDSAGDVWISNPLVSLYTDNKLDLIYYPFYDSELSATILDGFRDDLPDYVHMDTCGGGIICPKDDNVCQDNLEATYNLLRSDLETVYEGSWGRCSYDVFGVQTRTT